MKLSNKYIALAMLACVSATMPTAYGMKRKAEGDADQNEPKKARITQQDQRTGTHFDHLPVDLTMQIAGFIVDPNKPCAHWEKNDADKIVVAVSPEETLDVPNIAAINNDETAENLYSFLSGAFQDQKAADDLRNILGIGPKTLLNGKDTTYLALATGDTKNAGPLAENSVNLFKKYNKKTILDIVIERQHEAIVQGLFPYYGLFLEDEVNAENVITSATKTGNTKIMETLLKSKGLTSKVLRSCIQKSMAQKDANIDTITMLLSCMTDEADVASLLVAAFKTNSAEIVAAAFKAIVEQCKVIIPQDVLAACMYLAIEQKSPALLEIALEYGACPSKSYPMTHLVKILASTTYFSDGIEMSSLHMCIYNLRKQDDCTVAQECIKMLIDYGADRHLKTTPHYDCLKGQKISAVEYAVERAIKHVSWIHEVADFLKYYVARPKQAKLAQDPK